MSLTASPKLIKGGLVVLDAATGVVKRTIALQYNPDTIARSYQVQGVGGDGANKRYRLNPKQIESTFWTLKQLLSPENARPAEADVRAGQPEPLRRFLDADGRVTMWPAKRQSQDLLLSYLISKFEHGREYAEREVNQLLNQWHSYEDPATLRRALYDAQLLDRTLDGARYWRVPDPAQP